MKLRVLPEATREVIQTAAWYDDWRSGLGDSFISTYAARLEQIEEGPHRFPILETVDTPHEIRRAVLRRFPYAIVYQMLDAAAVVLAVMHLSRNPDYWMTRASQN